MVMKKHSKSYGIDMMGVKLFMWRVLCHITLLAKNQQNLSCSFRDKSLATAWQPRSERGSGVIDHVFHSFMTSHNTRKCVRATRSCSDVILKTRNWLTANVPLLGLSPFKIIGRGLKKIGFPENRNRSGGGEGRSRKSESEGWEVNSGKLEGGKWNESWN